MAFTTVASVVAGNKITAAWGNTVSSGVTETQAMVSGGETGPDNVGPTSGTTPLTIDTATLAAVGTNGRLHVWANVAVTKSTSTDRFSLTLNIAGVGVNRAVERATAGDTTVQFAVTGSAAVSSGATPTIDIILTRLSGAGTAQPSTGADTSLHYIFIPAP